MKLAIGLLLFLVACCPQEPPATTPVCPDAPYGRVWDRTHCVDCRGVERPDGDGGGMPPGEPCRRKEKP